LENNPTSDESTFKFTSDVADAEPPKSVSAKKRKIGFNDVIKTHLSQHWIGWIISLFLLIFGYLMLESRDRIARLETNVDNQKDSIKEIKDNIKEETKRNNEQDIKINENNVKVQLLQDHEGR
jgi:cell division protein FtsL